MLDNVKQIEPAVQIVPGPFRCISVDPEGPAQARTFYYKVVIPNPVQRYWPSLCIRTYELEQLLQDQPCISDQTRHKLIGCCSLLYGIQHLLRSVFNVYIFNFCLFHSILVAMAFQN